MTLKWNYLPTKEIFNEFDETYGTKHRLVKNETLCTERLPRAKHQPGSKTSHFLAAKGSLLKKRAFKGNHELR